MRGDHHRAARSYACANQRGYSQRRETTRKDIEVTAVASTLLHVHKFDCSTRVKRDFCVHRLRGQIAREESVCGSGRFRALQPDVEQIHAFIVADLDLDADLAA